MLKHCSASCVDVSRRSLRHSSLTLDRVMTSEIDTGGHGGQLYRQTGLCVSLYTIPSHGPASSVDTGSDTSSEADSSIGPPVSPASPRALSPDQTHYLGIHFPGPLP